MADAAKQDEVSKSELIEGWTREPLADGFYFLLVKGDPDPTVIEVYLKKRIFEIIGDDIDFELDEAIENGCLFHYIPMPPLP